MGWLIVVAGVAVFVAMEARRQKQRQAVLVGVPAGASASQPRSWRPSIIALYMLGPVAAWVVYRDMALDAPLWVGGLDSLIAFVGCFWIVGKLAPSHGQGSGGIVWGLSVAGWIFLLAGMAVAAEGRGVLEDLHLIVAGIWEWGRGLYA